jgi:hypothetical protein
MFFVMYVLGDAFWGNEDAKIGALSSAFSMTFEMNFEDVLGSDSTRHTFGIVDTKKKL